MYRLHVVCHSILAHPTVSQASMGKNGRPKHLKYRAKKWEQAPEALHGQMLCFIGGGHSVFVTDFLCWFCGCRISIQA